MGVAQEFANGDETSGTSHCLCSSFSPKPLVAVIDDDQSIRKSLVRSLQAAGYQVEGFACAAEFLASPVPETASCVVCDLRMPGVDGLQLQEMLRGKAPFLSFVFVTGYGDIPASVSAMKAGAVDFLEKPIRRSLLLEAVGFAVERTGHRRNEEAEIGKLRMQYERLTPREREVFVLVSAGLLNKQVAAQLGTAEKTVKQHRGSIMRKIEAASVADLVLLADRLGIRPLAANFAAAMGKTVN